MGGSSEEKGCQRAQLIEIQSIGNTLCAEIENAIASAKGQDQAITQTCENITKTLVFSKTLRTCVETMKTITEQSTWQDVLNMTFLAMQVELEALEFDPSNDAIVSKEELRKQAIVQAYEAIQLEIRDVKAQVSFVLIFCVSLTLVCMNLNIFGEIL